MPDQNRAEQHGWRLGRLKGASEAFADSVFNYYQERHFQLCEKPGLEKERKEELLAQAFLLRDQYKIAAREQLRPVLENEEVVTKLNELENCELAFLEKEGYKSNFSSGGEDKPMRLIGAGELSRQGRVRSQLQLISELRKRLAEVRSLNDTQMAEVKERKEAVKKAAEAAKQNLHFFHEIQKYDAQIPKDRMAEMCLRFQASDSEAAERS